MLTSIAITTMLFLLPGVIPRDESVVRNLPTPSRSITVDRQSAVAPEINMSALWDGRKEVDFHSLSFPSMTTATHARFLIDDEYVLGIAENGQSRAYPTRFISWHHIINDRIGDKSRGDQKFVTVTYCIVCNSGMRFDTPIVHDKPAEFDFYGLYNGVMTMYDKGTQSVWLQVQGRAVKGPLKGAVMKQGAVTDTTWGQWKQLHPDTLVMEPDPKNVGNYERRGTVMVRGYSSFPADYFAPTLTYRDRRLPGFEPVMACSVAQPSGSMATASNQPVTGYLHRAYPLRTFKRKTGAINDLVGSVPIAVLYLAHSETVSVVSRVIDGRCLTLQSRSIAKGRTAFFDRETGTRWSVEGVGIAGPLKGRQLERVNSHMSQWYGWVSYFPQTSIYGLNSPRTAALSKEPRRSLLVSRHN